MAERPRSPRSLRNYQASGRRCWAGCKWFDFRPIWDEAILGDRAGVVNIVLKCTRIYCVLRERRRHSIDGIRATEDEMHIRQSYRLLAILWLVLLDGASSAAPDA